MNRQLKYYNSNKQFKKNIKMVISKQFYCCFTLLTLFALINYANAEPYSTATSTTYSSSNPWVEYTTMNDSNSCESCYNN
jgi:hypothetical protein